MRFYVDSSVRIQVNNGMHSLELTSNSAMVRSVPSEPEDQGSNPGFVTPFFQKAKKVVQKIGRRGVSNPGLSVQVREAQPLHYLCIPLDMLKQIYFSLY
jgi:hypothetical protein